MISKRTDPVLEAQILVTRIVKTLVKDERVVRVDAETSEAETVLRLHVAVHDVGKVIGTEGRIADSVRTILTALGAKEGVRFRLNIAAANRMPRRLAPLPSAYAEVEMRQSQSIRALSLS